MTNQSLANSTKKGWRLIVIGFAVLLILILLVFLFLQPRNQKELLTAPSETPLPNPALLIDPTASSVEATKNADTVSLPEPVPPTTIEQKPTIGSIRVSEIDGMEQVYIPAGEFLMGTNDVEAKREIIGGRAYPEIPQFSYFLDEFWIDKYEVTNKQYRDCMDAGACTDPHRIGSYSYPDYFSNPAYDHYPVVWVTWFQATDYCKWVERRLPTEAEWEKAARGIDGRKYPWGNDPYTEDKANICDVNCTRTHRLPEFDDGYPDLAPVGSYPNGVSPYGALDMAGNAWEWNSTEIIDYPYDANDGREDPGGIDIERGWRGSSWANGLWWLRSSVRYHALDFYSWYVLGFRCAASAK